MKHIHRFTGTIAVGVFATLWLAGCGGGSSTASAPTTPNTPTNPSNPSLPSTSRTRLYQHGDEFIYTIAGVAQYLGQRYEVSGTRTVRIASAGAGVLRITRTTELRLRRGSQVYDDNHQIVFYVSQDRQSREVTFLGYALDSDDPIISANLPYRVCVPGILNENSNFAFSTPIEDGTFTSETWQIGVIEPVSTYAGLYNSYRMRVEFQWDYPAPFPEVVSVATCWFSPQLGVMTRAESTEQNWLNSDPVEYRLTYILYRTNVSLQSAAL
ncbi:MAG: hypothetical protein NZM28_04315 [Fimbriimonadales bacterium]|nr:hypothetical protein [Fimbriimonadales bacterium]